MNHNLLSQPDKLKIAEFIFAFECDTLIKSEAQDVIDVLKAHGVQAAQTAELNAHTIMLLITSEIDSATRSQLMRDYYAGVLG